MKENRQYYSPQTDGFYGAFYACPSTSESMLKIMLPVGGSVLVGAAFQAGRKYPNECRKTRQDIDRKIRQVIKRW